jgi:hypothetical protein
LGGAGWVLPATLVAQGLRDHLVDLFTVGGQAVPFRVVALRDPAAPATGVVPDDGFSPATVAPNASVVDFITKWVDAYPANIPVSATSGGVTFTFAGGSPVRTTVSAGPIVSERAATLGRGRIAVGVDYADLTFNTLRGLPLENVRLLFTRAGDPDILEVLLTLDLRMHVASAYASVGVLDELDVGVVVPVVHTRLDASSIANLLAVPEGAGGVPVRFLGGVPETPILSSTQVVRGSATGLGDIAFRAKARVATRERLTFAVLGDVHLPTGREEDLLGAGYTAVRALAVGSGRFGTFSPHLNIGYLWRNTDRLNDAILASVGFDQVVAPWATLAAGVLGEVQIGRSAMQVPDPLIVTSPVVTTIQPLAAPDTRDTPVTAAFGVKFTTFSNLTATVNTLVPLSRTGPRPDWAWSTGLEVDF